MDIDRDICTDSFYIVNSGLPCIPVTAVHIDQLSIVNINMMKTKMEVHRGKNPERESLEDQPTLTKINS